jgi:hypothetical protein
VSGEVTLRLQGDESDQAQVRIFYSGDAHDELIIDEINILGAPLGAHVLPIDCLADHVVAEIYRRCEADYWEHLVSKAEASR